MNDRKEGDMNREEIFKQEFCYNISECGRWFEHYSEDGIRRFLITSIEDLTANSTTWRGVVHESVIQYVIHNGEDKFARVWMFLKGQVAAPGQWLSYALPCDNMKPMIVVSVYPSSEYKAFCIDHSDNEELKVGRPPAMPLQAFGCYTMGYNGPELYGEGNNIRGLNEAMEYLATPSDSVEDDPSGWITGTQDDDWG